MNIHIANISMLRHTFEDNDNFYDIQKLNNVTVINSSAKMLPNNIRNGLISGLSAGVFTDLSNKLPCTYVKEEYSVTERELLLSEIVINKIKISGKDFYVFNSEFVKNLDHKIGYVLNAEETKECTRTGKILGSVKLSKNKFFTWY